MIAAGELDPSASRSAIAYMAGRWLAEQVRGRERKLARAGESAVRVNRTEQVLSAAREVARAASAQHRVKWSTLYCNTFALPNGERVTWGLASIEQHEARAAMLEVMAAGDLETASLHRAAVAEIRDAGGDSLQGDGPTEDERDDDHA